ncbi:MAG: hypothetical protein KIS88_08825 [Anaerolineales bacterium]|nr:hypothetical protein [Anaerolineales bacterium]
MEFIRFIAAPFTVLYGLLALLAGPQQWRLGKVATAAANSLMLVGGILVVAGYLVWVQSLWALWVLGIGLLSMHVLAAINRAKASEGGAAKGGTALDWSGQGGRLLISVTLFALAYLSLQ